MSSNVIEFVLSAKDKMSKPMGLAAKSFRGVTSSIFSLKGALGGLALGAVAKSFIDAANTTEQLNIRLGVLLGSVEEGNRLFSEMTQFASEVPFEFEEIMESSTALAGVMKGGVDEIKEWMPLIGDLAATTGLGIQETTEQVQRMLSAGAASADKFRERGVTAMLGFQSGVSYSAEETKQRLMDAWKDPLSKFKGATKQLATSWTGIMSMIGDKWFAIKTTIMDSGLMDFLKAIGTTIDKYMGNTLANVKVGAKDLTGSIIAFADSVASFMSILSTIARGVQIAFKSVYIVIQSLVAASYAVFNAVGQSYVDFRKLLDEDFKEPTFLRVIKLASIDARKQVVDTKNEIVELATSEWPATGIENFKNEVVSSFIQIREQSKLTKNAKDKAAESEKTYWKTLTTEQQNYLTKNSEDNMLEVEQLREKLEGKIIALQEYNMLESEIVNAKYVQDLLNLENYYMMSGMADAQYAQLKENLEAKHQKNLAATRKNALQGSFDFAEAIRQKDLAAGLAAGMQMLSQLATQNKTAFRIQKAMALAKAVVTLPSAVMQSFDNGGGYPWGLIPAGLMLATGLKNISDIKNTQYGGQAHSGLTNVPREGTYLLDKGERVIQPDQNRDLTSFLGGSGSEGSGGSITISQLNISVLENATSGDALLNMDSRDLEEVIAAKFIPALNALSNRGITQDAITQAEDV